MIPALFSSPKAPVADSRYTCKCCANSLWVTFRTTSHRPCVAEFPASRGINCRNEVESKSMSTFTKRSLTKSRSHRVTTGYSPLTIHLGRLSKPCALGKVPSPPPNSDTKHLPTHPISPNTAGALSSVMISFFAPDVRNVCTAFFLSRNNPCLFWPVLKKMWPFSNSPPCHEPRSLEGNWREAL